MLVRFEQMGLNRSSRYTSQVRKNLKPGSKQQRDQPTRSTMMQMQKVTHIPPQYHAILTMTFRPVPVRSRAAGHYQFSQDEAKRAEQMAALKAERDETQQAREEIQGRAVEVAAGPPSHGEPAKRKVMLTAAQEMKKRKLDERKAMIEAKRIKVQS